MEHAVGAVLSLGVAVALFSRFGIDGHLSRDEAIYAYGGMQLAAHGTPPYLSIFDPKTPGATLVSGAAAALADAVGRNELLAVRAAFFVAACLTVLAVHLLATRLWGSVTAGLCAAVVFASFDGFARDALSGPDAKTPGVLCAVVAMWLLLRRRWFLGALLGSAAALFWQPFAVYPVVAVLLAGRCSLVTGRAGPAVRGVTGALLPPAVTVAAFTAAGALRPLVESTVVFPLLGLQRRHVTWPERFERVGAVVGADYHLSGLLFWAGGVALALLLAWSLARLLPGARRRPGDGSGGGAARTPGLALSVVGLTFVAEWAYAFYDFQSYPDLYPLLPYAALGVGGVVAVLVHASRSASVRGTVTALSLVGALLLTSYSWTWFGTGPENEHRLHRQQADARILQQALGPSGRLLALGTPQPLVLTGRRNPGRYIYLGSGVAAWKVAHTPGGFAGWTRQVAADRPAVVVMATWKGPVHRRMSSWLLGNGYRPARLGRWHLYLTPVAKHRVQLPEVGR